jgi:hypothetical protein
VKSTKLIFNACINSPHHSTLQASLPKSSTIATAAFISTGGMACHSATYTHQSACSVWWDRKNQQSAWTAPTFCTTQQMGFVPQGEDSQKQMSWSTLLDYNHCTKWMQTHSG